jgi:SAM-dependent methyltransferase
MSYNPANLEEVKARMDDEFRRGVAYQSSLPFDSVRATEIRGALLRLAVGEPGEDAAAFGQTLDLGCGEGGVASFWPHHRILGVEISEVAVGKARAAYPDVTYVCAPVETFVLPEGTPPIECVVACEAIEHWVDPGPALDNVRRQVRPGTTLVLSTPNRDSLHCRMSAKLGLGEPPYCSYDHVHEYGYRELIAFVEAHGWAFDTARGATLTPLWACEHAVGNRFRQLTDNDPEVCDWFATIGRQMPAEFAFCVAYRFKAR